MTGYTAEELMASDLTISARRAERIVNGHGIDWAEWLRDFGYEPIVRVADLFRWLGY